MKWIWSPFFTFSLATPSTGFSSTTLIVSTSGAAAVVVGAASVVVAGVVAGGAAVAAAAVVAAAGAAAVVVSVESSLPQAATRPVVRTSASTLVIVRFMGCSSMVRGLRGRRTPAGHGPPAGGARRGAGAGRCDRAARRADRRAERRAAVEPARDRDGGSREQTRGHQRDDAERQLQHEAGQYRRLRERVDGSSAVAIARSRCSCTRNATAGSTRNTQPGTDPRGAAADDLARLEGERGEQRDDAADRERRQQVEPGVARGRGRPDGSSQ